ncbi:protein phosphatase 1 regulatory subunit 37-like [Nilaparvata lugens]|uniref:protein phosphatase 1 regulatory subunit 37-like n=1 Tax=Nilaparvata lugens TaxID=108931 RepID=UPI00193E189D|nr:protein phosphatase 1 regulatory subunit 37-like [Nilaparvata lugens]
MNKEANIKSDPLSRDIDSKTTLSDGSMQSCFRNRNENIKNSKNRRVCFAEDETDLVTGYLEPPNPWEFCENVNKEEVISSYLESCEKHGSRPISSVLEQLQDLDFTLERNACLDLKGRTLTPLDCETLEEILKRVQFIAINLEQTSIDDESSVALFDMVEYYEAAVSLNISGNHSIGVQGWQACSRMIKRTKCLEELEARNTTLTEQYMPILSRALRLSSQLVVLKLENCNLSGRPIVILAAALRLNTCLKELYVGENYLGTSDASQLGAMLKCNATMQLLDISNNNIQDGGMKHIADGICEQSSQQSDSSVGLSVLVLWNNHLTLNSSKHIAKVLASSKTLETLNVGQNILSNEVLFATKHVLQQNKALLRLGMQSTHLTCEGAVALAEIIADNSTIERIDLRDNNLQVAGLMALVHSMKVNSSVTQLDLDDSPRRKYSGNALEEYSRLVKEIRSFCQRNDEAKSSDTTSEDVSEPGMDDSADDSTSSRQNSFALRKISLTCETLMKTTSLPPVDTSSTNLLVEPRRSGGRLRSPAPSPIPSPVASPSPTRSRFQVSRVSESDSPTTPPSTSPSPPTIFFATSSSSAASSRFKVTVVDAAPAPIPVTTVVPSNNVTKGFDIATTHPKTEPPKLVESRASPRTSPLRSRSDTEESVDSPKSKLPKAMDSIDLSALRISKQVSVSENPAPSPSARTRKISWVQPSSIFSTTTQDEVPPVAGKPSQLGKLFGLFSNPFSRSADPPTTIVPDRSSSNSSCTSDKPQPNCDKNADIVKKTAGEFLEQTLNLFSGSRSVSSDSQVMESSDSGGDSVGSPRQIEKRAHSDKVIIEETDQELMEAARDSNNCSISNTSSSNSSNDCESNRAGSTSSSDSSNLEPPDEHNKQVTVTDTTTKSPHDADNSCDNLTITEPIFIVECCGEGGEVDNSNDCMRSTNNEEAILDHSVAGFVDSDTLNNNNDNNSIDNSNNNLAAANLDDTTQNDSEVSTLNNVEEVSFQGNVSPIRKNQEESLTHTNSEDVSVQSDDVFTHNDAIETQIQDVAGKGNEVSTQNNLEQDSAHFLKEVSEKRDENLAQNNLEKGFAELTVGEGTVKGDASHEHVDEGFSQMSVDDVCTSEREEEQGKAADKGPSGAEDAIRWRRSSEDEDACETWPQANNKLLHRFGGPPSPSVDLHSSSAPCLTALVFLQGNVSSNLAAELKKISPTESADSLDSATPQPQANGQPQSQTPSQQDLGVVL